MGPSIVASWAGRKLWPGNTECYIAPLHDGPYRSVRASLGVIPRRSRGISEITRSVQNQKLNSSADRTTNRLVSLVTQAPEIPQSPLAPSG